MKGICVVSECLEDSIYTILLALRAVLALYVIYIVNFVLAHIGHVSQFLNGVVL